MSAEFDALSLGSRGGLLSAELLMSVALAAQACGERRSSIALSSADESRACSERAVSDVAPSHLAQLVSVAPLARARAVSDGVCRARGERRGFIAPSSAVSGITE